MTNVVWTGLLAVSAGLFQTNLSPIPTDKATKVVEGTVRAAAPGRIHTEEIIKGSPRAVIIELR